VRCTFLRTADPADPAPDAQPVLDELAGRSRLLASDYRTAVETLARITANLDPDGTSPDSI